MRDWRQDLATDRQKRRMKEEGIRFKRSITKGEASDLIGETESASEYDIAILKYFRIPGAAKMSETAAKRMVADLFSDPANETKWENRGADAEQKAIYKFFHLPIQSGLKHKNAAAVIGNLFEDEEKEEAWFSHLDGIAERQDELEDALDILDMYREEYDCRKIGKRQCKTIAEALEQEGMRIPDMAELENLDRFFHKALAMFPQLRREPRQTPTHHRRGNRHSSLGWLLLIILILIIIGMFAK